MKKIFNKFGLVGIVSFICFIFLNCVKVSATVIDLSITSSELYSQTNTYDYNVNVIDNENMGKEGNRRYVMNYSDNGNVVDTGSPMLTVLTHGYINGVILAMMNLDM